MVVFPNCKINLGLKILDERPDGFHNLQSVFIPIQFCDTLEIVESEIDELFIYGRKIEGDKLKNSCFKALQILRTYKKFPAVNIHLLKIIPTGAGLGGGSSDGAFTLLLLNKKFTLGFSENELTEMALQLGSDCPFFIRNKKSFVEGRGEKLTDVNFPLLNNLVVAIAVPEIQVETSMAFRQLTYQRAKQKNYTNSLQITALETAPETWKYHIVNDFESVIFPMHPEIAQWKLYFYKYGALYSSLSGSGSTVYAFFDSSYFSPEHEQRFKKNKNIFLAKMKFEEERK